MARFIGDANLVEGMLDGDKVDTLFGRLPVEQATGPGRGLAPRSGPVTVLVRPEQVELGAADGDAGRLPGRVVGYGYHGHDAVVKVQPEQDPGAPVVIVRTLGAGGLPPGSLVTLWARGPVRAWPQPQPAAEPGR
jgi:ABC-type Fe3+/spermidine/putrescine transport system ATPase subunit